jgi:hypothetical protein
VGRAVTVSARQNIDRFGRLPLSHSSAGIFALEYDDIYIPESMETYYTGALEIMQWIFVD